MIDRQYFRRIAAGLEPAAAIAELSKHTELWSLITLRQDYAGSAHRDTETIVLRGPTSIENLFEDLECIDYDCFTQLYFTANLLREALAPLHWRELGRVMIVRLKAGGRITPHVDEGRYARYFARFHLVLESSLGCLFTAGGESVHMAPGELWWFNHQVEHSVVNNGPDRTHIIVDLTAPGFTGALGRPV